MGEILDHYRPMGDRLLIRPDKAEDMTRGGLYLPQSVVAEKQKEMYTGTVIAVGPGMLTRKGTRFSLLDGVKPGSRVLFMREGALPVKIEDEILLSIRDDFLQAEVLP